jgi:hypothetical protein
LPAAQAECAFAWFVPPVVAACAAPSRRVRQPVPAHTAWTCAMSFAALPTVPAWQAPAAVQVAVPVAVTVAPPTAFVRDEARVAQPALAPLSQVAAT